VFQSEELAERAHLAFGFTNTSAPFLVTSERIDAEYQVKFRYIGEAVFQPDQQLVVYYNGAPAGWLWILPYMVSGQISWFSQWNPTRWQKQNPIDSAIVEGGTIPGMPIQTQGNETSDALVLTIDQAYAQWSDEVNIDLTFTGVDQDGNELTMTFFNKDVVDVDVNTDELTLFINGKWVDWLNDWDFVQVTQLSAVLDVIVWGENRIQMIFEVGN